jgi:hypothetical protein
MQNYDFTLSGTGASQINTPTRNLHYLEGVEAGGLSAIRIRGQGGRVDLRLRPGEGVELPQEENRLTLSKDDPGAGDITGTMLLGPGRFYASRVQGDVSILNATGVAGGAHGRLIDGLDLVGFAAVVTASGTGNLGFWLRNPVGSGKYLIVTEWAATRTTDPALNQWGWGYVDAAAAGCNGGAETGTVDELSGAALVALTSTAVNPTATTVGYAQNGAILQAVAVRDLVVRPPTPYIVAPGRAMKMGLMAPSVSDTATKMRVRWIERAA